jgi:hypothetical protein
VNRPLLVLRPCAFAVARRAVERWHYSARMPAAVVATYAAYEDGRFIGTVVFGHGANHNLAAPFGLRQAEVVELVRVALGPEHATPTTQVVAAGLQLLHVEHPHLRLVVSYADSAHGHIGTLYQAGNWHYLGPSTASVVVIGGRAFHRRSLHQRYRTSRLDWLRQNVDAAAFAVTTPPKHKYVLGLDGQMRRRLRRLAKPYPCAVKGSTVTRPVSNREGGVQLALTAPSASPLSCGRRSDPTGSPAAPAARR